MSETDVERLSRNATMDLVKRCLAQLVVDDVVEALKDTYAASDLEEIATRLEEADPDEDEPTDENTDDE